MGTKQGSDLDFESIARILNLPPAVATHEPATFGQLQSYAEGLKDKDPVRVRTGSNINLASPGATLDGVTMAANDRVLAGAQTAGQDNGIYNYNGPSTPMTRALDANTAAEVTGILVRVLEGTGAPNNVTQNPGTYRQTATSVTLGTTPLVFVAFGVAVQAATDTAPGIVELATTAETTTGTDATRAVTPAGLSNSIHARKSYNVDFGDGTSTSYVLTHNLGSKNVHPTFRENGGLERGAEFEWRATSINAITVVSAGPIASNAIHASISLAS